MNGPRDCNCYFCQEKTDPRQRGKSPCEYCNHHCTECHRNGKCTDEPCVKERKRAKKVQKRRR